MDNASGNLYVADTGNNTIRKITIPAGVVSTLAGNATQRGSADGVGSAALFFNPSGIGVDPAGNIYVADVNNNTIRRITPAGLVVTIVGAVGKSGAQPGPLPASLGAVHGIAVDPSANGNLYINMLNAVYTAPY
jgi:DNA-binding beta-propeller fold protein YncE